MGLRSEIWRNWKCQTDLLLVTSFKNALSPDGLPKIPKKNGFGACEVPHRSSRRIKVPQIAQKATDFRDQSNGPIPELEAIPNLSKQYVQLY